MEAERMETEDILERRKLCIGRLRKVKGEKSVPEEYRAFFEAEAEKLLLIFEYETMVADGKIREMPLPECQKLFDALYAEILPQNYETSFSNPKYAVSLFGKRYGRLLTYLAAKLNQLIFFAAEQKEIALVMYAELFIEIYNSFEEFHEYTFKECREALYSFEYDAMERFAGWTFEDRYNAEECFAREIILDYKKGERTNLYRYGEYITENELRIAAFLDGLSKQKLTAMAKNVVEGFLRGFKVMRVKLVRGENVQLRYPIGFERMMKEVIALLAKEGLTATAVRTAPSERYARKAGYTVTNVNLQYDYDHRNDDGLLLDKQWFLRKEEVSRRMFEAHRESMGRFAGPLVVETFGERLPLPVNKPDAIVRDKRQQRLLVESRGRVAQMQEEYLPSDSYSFTIVAYPLPSIGERFVEIFEDTLRLNQLDNEMYIRVQQCIIDALDQAERVHVTGRGRNHTDITVELWKLKNKETETIFENCTADVNIPAGEVFTSPVLAGTNGVLHVTSVFLGSTEYKDLELVFKDGKTTSYRCANYESEEENKSFLRETLLKNHDWLPLGEFAIGTNTIAYMMGKKYGITGLLPILIAEKTGPHFAVGDTCYSHSEEHVVYNPDGKEIVARENECSALRNSAPEQAYFQCHTDITIPYSELGEITAVCADGTRIPVIQDGRFVLPGTEMLNEAFEEA